MNMHSRQEFYLLAGMVGLVQGGVQALSRSFFSGLIPQDNAAQFFGFFNMVGKYSVILGPALMGVSAYVTRSPRAGIASLLIFFLIGGILLWFVPGERKK
jgi:UMF1 family MFS transporter